MEFKVGDRLVGDNHAVFIVAELSSNHLQNFELAVKTIKAMKESGADAVKLQTYTPDTLTINSDSEYFQINQGTLWDGKTLYKLYQEAYTPWEWQPELKKIARDLGLICFSTPFDKTAVDFLEKMGVDVYKVASFEITDISLVEYIAAKGKPIIMSTGIATYSDIEEAVGACRKMGNDRIALLKCTSSYPSSPGEINLKTLPNLAEEFNVIPGLSDHTQGISSSIASVALGAKIIERHFILDKKLKSPDAAFSLTPGEFTRMAKSIREAEEALGEISYELTKKARDSRKFSRSLFVVKDIRAGETFTEENVRSIRPANGLHTRYLKEILGRKAKKDIKGPSPLGWSLIG